MVREAIHIRPEKSKHQLSRFFLYAVLFACYESQSVCFIVSKVSCIIL